MDGVVGMTGIPPSCYAGAGCRNGCAQAAVAWLLSYRDARFRPAGPEAVNEVYRRWRPDTPFALFGTTPGHLERICRSYGVKTERFWGRRAPDRLRRELAAGRVMVVLLDLARLGAGWGLHYVVAHQFDEDRVYCANLLPAPRDAAMPDSLPWALFLRAWGSWLPLPRFQHAGMVVW
jgi:hypothetical protein